jgi:hypothetical protein
MKISTRQAFQHHLKRQYSLRLHMFAILLATTLSGILFSKSLLFFDVIDFRIRYPLVVIFSYLIFFVCIRLWLSCISSFRQSKTSATDWIDFPDPSFAGEIRNALPSIHGSGGQFGGAGASGSLDVPEQSLVDTASLPESPTSIGEGVAEALGDDNIIIVVIVLVALVSTILISAVILLYGAPAILAEAAFEGVLAASLIKRTQTISDKAWAGSVLKATWKPFAVTIGVAFIAGIVLHSYFPNAVRLADILGKM